MKRELDNQLLVSSQHPALPGHFPGQPIVPGVVILRLVTQQLRQQLPDWHIGGIKKLKFLAPLAGDQNFTLHCKPVKNNGVRFKCLLDDGSVLADGHIRLHPIGA
jgi:3-hydroxymyristoyl/3-hydroxydecanoyl-(acyl carrier protein) dehydratase